MWVHTPDLTQARVRWARQRCGLGFCTAPRAKLKVTGRRLFSRVGAKAKQVRDECLNCVAFVCRVARHCTAL